MENERLYELRSRSRSGTPLVQSRALIEPEISERRYDLRSRSKERSPGEVTLLVSTVFRLLRRANRVRLEFCFRSGNDPESTTERSATKLERRSERQKARRQIHANGRTADGKVATTLTSDYSSEEGEDLSTNRPSSAHEIYKQAGDWWKYVFDL
ncbi:hypothetical protein WH47_06850 [Habropoda laboriosa]|uniref:Uncharacterized protein n=1 Tax=Habropoda laboriosa TaxID=597456 RepID=A0A0L7RIX1_9HYME|nr:hypothetical protein WH47_06850 [Habropoda laboriosa]